MTPELTRRGAGRSMLAYAVVLLGAVLFVAGAFLPHYGVGGVGGIGAVIVGLLMVAGAARRGAHEPGAHEGPRTADRLATPDADR